MAIVCNMGAELGATFSCFQYTAKMHDYLVAINRQSIAEYAHEYAADFQADPESERFYNRVIDIDLDMPEPHINGPFSPDLATPLGQFKDTVHQHGWPEISVALIGSCTNASYEDMCRAASVAQDALNYGLRRAACPLKVTPGSEMTRRTLERDGRVELLSRMGASTLANACGPCTGNWNRHGVGPGRRNSILSSHNRNFAGRNDGSAGTHAFVASPEVVVAMSLAGSLLFNPLTDFLEDKIQVEPAIGANAAPKGI